MFDRSFAASSPRPLLFPILLLLLLFLLPLLLLRLLLLRLLSTVGYMDAGTRAGRIRHTSDFLKRTVEATVDEEGEEGEKDDHAEESDCADDEDVDEDKNE
jgi:hypothetical protein